MKNTMDVSLISRAAFVDGSDGSGFPFHKLRSEGTSSKA